MRAVHILLHNVLDFTRITCWMFKLREMSLTGNVLLRYLRYCVKCQRRGVRHRSVSYWQFQTPWPFVHRRTGLVSYGPYYKEEWEWPGEKHSEFTPKFRKNNLPMLRDYTGVQQTGYVDAQSGEFVRVPEMVPEIAVPDLKGFELKPYVSFRTDAQIEKKEEALAKANKEYEKLLKSRDASKKALSTAKEKVENLQWPPPPLTARMLFDVHYRDEVVRNFRKGKYSITSKNVTNKEQTED